MISLLVVDGTGQLAGQLKGQGLPSGGFEIIAAKDPAEAIGILEERDIEVLAIDGRSDTIDPLAATTWAVRFKPDLRLVFVTEEATPAPGRVSGHSSGPVFLNVDDLERHLGLIFGSNGNSGGRKPSTAVDALDVSRIAGLRCSTGAVQIFADGRSGTLRYEDGVLVHAASGTVSGSDAFFSMMLWPRGDIQRLSDEEAQACERNVWFPSAFLFQEAERFRDVLEVEGSDPETGFAGATSGGETEVDRQSVWKSLAQNHPSGIRVIVACSNRCEGSCFRKTLTEMGDSLNSEPPWLSEALDGPSFARIHASYGGTLALTRVPLTRRHEYLLETLSKAAEITLLCGEMESERIDEIKRRSSNKIVSAIGGAELTADDLWSALNQLADGGSAE